MSSEGLKSLIVTDPSLLDEGIDVSGLRTETDTDPRLLASIADFPGISYDPTSFDYLSDLNELFAYGLPGGDTSGAVTPPVTTTPDTGGGGQETSPSITDTIPELSSGAVNTAEEQRLIDAGIGVQGAPGDPVVAPGEIPVTQQEIDEFNRRPVTPVGGQPIDPTGMLPQTPEVVAQDPTTMVPQLGSITPTVAEGTATLEDAGGTYPIVGDDIDVLQSAEGGLGEEVNYTPEQENIIQEILSKAGQNVEGAITQLGKIPGAIVDFANQTVDVFGKKINVGATLAKFAINKIAGGPISLVFDVLSAILPKDTLEQSTSRNIVNELKAEKDYGFNMQTGNMNQDPFGRNPPAVNYEQKLKDDLLGINQSGFQTAKFLEKKQEFAQDYFNKKAEYAGGVEVDEGTVLGPGEAPGDVVSLDDMLREQRDERIGAGIQAAEDDKGDDMLDTGTNIVDEVALTGGDTPNIIEDIGIENIQKSIDQAAKEKEEQEQEQAEGREAFRIAQQREADQAFADQAAKEKEEQEQIEAEYREANRIAQQREADQAFADQAAQKTTPAPSGPPEDVRRGGGADSMPSAPSQPDYSNVTTASAPPGRGGGSGGSPGQGGGSPGAGSGCVIATHAVNSGAFTKDTKREAVRWCVKNLHRTWWGEAIRRGYKYYGQKAIEEGKAKNHYQEFKNYVAFGTGKKRTLKTGWTFVYRTVQFFLKGLTL